MALDPFAAIRARIRDRKNPNAKFEQLKYAAAQARVPYDREVWLNTAFYLNYHYVTWSSRHLSLVEIRSKDFKPHTPRPIANKMMHFAAQAHATALQDKPTVDVLPATDDPIDIGHTSVARAYLTYISEPTVARFDKKLSDATLWAVVGGEGYLKWVYNPRLRRPDIVACSPLDIYPDPYAPDFYSARYVIHTQFMDREQIYEIWGKEVRDNDTNAVDPLKSDLLRHMGCAPVLSGVEVNELWMRPCRRYPRGLYTVWTCHDQLVEPTDFPYDHGHLPFTQLGMIPLPMGLHYASALRYMRSTQMELNNYHRQKILNRQLHGNPKWFLPEGLELEAPPDDSPGQILRANSGGQLGLEPRILQPQYMADNNDGDWIAREMMDIVGQHEVSQAQVPGRVEAAKAIDMLREADVSRLSVLHDTMKSAISEGFWQVLQLARQYVADEVIVQTYSREGLPEVKRFKTDAFKPGMRVRVTMGTGLARSRAAREDQLLNYWQNGIITDPDQIAQLLDMPTPSFNESTVYDMRKARNENLEMANGAAITPNSWDDHRRHLQVHNDFRKTLEYDLLDPEIKQRFEFHCQMHDELEVAQLAKELEKSQLAAQVMAMQQQLGGPAGTGGAAPPPEAYAQEEPTDTPPSDTMAVT